MVPKPPINAIKKQTTQRLAVNKLQVKNPNLSSDNPCMVAMTAVLGCWASQGQAAANCLALEQSLRGCMDTKGAQAVKKSAINHNLSRFYKSFRGPVKRN